MRTLNSYFRAISLTLFLAFPVLAGAKRTEEPVQTPVPESSQAPAQAETTVLAIFSDRPMTDELWPHLAAALREDLASGAPETRVLIVPASKTQIVRGDSIVPGLRTDHPISIYLRGDCVLALQPRPVLLFQVSVSGPLGWVQRDHGRIEPFIHVECTRLAQLLASEAYGLDRDGRSRLMAAAIARVILHEWIHIATQSERHAQEGLGKAAFGPRDLVARANVRKDQDGKDQGGRFVRRRPSS
jgi:hypothetical protein